MEFDLMKTPLAAALILAAFATGARAEDMMAPPTDLPPICLANAAHGTMGMGSMAMGAAPIRRCVQATTRIADTQGDFLRLRLRRSLARVQDQRALKIFSA